MSTPQMARKNLQQQQAPSAALLHQSSIGKLLHHSQTRTSDAILISFEKLISFFFYFFQFQQFRIRIEWVAVRQLSKYTEEVACYDQLICFTSNF